MVDESPLSDFPVEKVRDLLTFKTVREEGFGNYLRKRAWASLLWLTFLWLLASVILFPLVGVIAGSFTAALVVAPLLGVLLAGAIGYWGGYLEPLDRTRKEGPLWVKMATSMAMFLLFTVLLFFALSAFIEGFTTLILVDLTLAAILTGAVSYLLDLWDDVPDRVEAAPLWGRLLLPLPVVALLFGLVFLVLGSSVDNFRLFLFVAVLASITLTGVGVWFIGLWADVPERVRSAPIWVRLLLPIPLAVAFFAVIFFALGGVIEDFRLFLFVDSLLATILTGAVVWISGLWHGWRQELLGLDLWVRLLLPIPMVAVLSLLVFFAIGGLITAFEPLLLLSLLAGLVLTGVIVWISGLWVGLRARIQDTSPAERLLTLSIVALLGGGLLVLLSLFLIGSAAVAFATLLPGTILVGFATAVVLGWAEDARDALQTLHFGFRVGLFVLLLVALTFYFALLIGPFLPNATLGYAASAAVALLLLVPPSVWARTWRDIWTAFIELGGEHRLYATLPALPLGIALIFGLIVVLTSMFEVAYLVSIPAGVLLFLLVGVPFGVTQDIPSTVRSRNLPARTGIFAGFLLLTTLYAYFAIALFVQIIEVALLGGLAFAGFLLAFLVWRFNLGEGLGEEFESYGGPAEAAVLGGVFLTVTALVFGAVGLASGDVRIAFLISVFVGAAVNFIVAHSTGFVEGTRDALAGLPWWGELLVLSTIFALAFVYGVLAVGLFLASVSTAFALGALLGLAAVAALSHDLELGEEIMETADEKKRARSAILVLTFLGCFLAGLYVAAAALGVAGIRLFGFPLFIALATGVGGVVFVAWRRGWDDEVISTVRTTTDKIKVTVLLTAWIGLGILTGYALQALPIEGPIYGIGDPSGLPLTLTLAAGMLLWAWLPAVGFRAVHVSQTPVDVTVAAGEKKRAMASLAWGLLVFAVLLFVGLTVMGNTVLASAIAIAGGYGTALTFSILGGRRAAES